MRVRVLEGRREPRDVTSLHRQPMTSDLMHALVDRSDVNLSPRVLQEAEELLHDCFMVGVRAWKYMRTHEKELWMKRKYDP